MEKFITVNGKKAAFTNEKNLLEVIRKENIEIPTFCYHSELSIYGACRLCIVEVQGRGIVPACSTPPENGMVVQTSTEEVRNLRRVIIELLLANHDGDCTACSKSENCQLQTLSRKLGVKSVRYKNVLKKEPRDLSTPAIVRDPSKCVLCGDCVRMCEEVQSVGAIDFAWRGSKTVVCPSFNKNLNKSQCVYCGQCARVCPTGALTPKTNVTEVWHALADKNKTVVVAIAPAVRAAIGEMFGVIGDDCSKAAAKIATALREMGFSKVYDVSFMADLTTIEEANEFVGRVKENKNLPLFTSCCPSWVRFVEQYYPEMLNNVSTARSPQGMYGSIVKNILPQELNIKKEDVIVVSVMPCTAKKFEITRPELATDGKPDVDFVITTQELGRMIEEAGINFNALDPSAFDMPLGFKTGAGVIFGNTGGVTESVLRNAVKIEGSETEAFAFIRGENGVREASANIGGREVKVAVVNGLANARRVVRAIRDGKANYDFIEVMACPGGCVGGAGQPVYKNLNVRKARARCLYENDQMLELHKPQDNPYVEKLYAEHLGKVGGEKAHKLLHVPHKSSVKSKGGALSIHKPKEEKVRVNICFGTSCMSKGSQKLLKNTLDILSQKGLENSVSVNASFCFEKCGKKGPMASVDDRIIEEATPEKIAKIVDEEIQKN
jgi:NADH-quinone oxidoreductase subunit G